MAMHTQRTSRMQVLHTCSDCGKSFDRPSVLRRHLNVHTGVKPHPCDVCGKSFTTLSSLVTHKRIHEGVRPHECPVCHKRFTASSNLYYHRYTHGKEKPFWCSEASCSRSFTTPGALRHHSYTHTGNWPFKCSSCARGFSRARLLQEHMVLHVHMQNNVTSKQKSQKKTTPKTKLQTGFTIEEILSDDFGPRKTLNNNYMCTYQSTGI